MAARKSKKKAPRKAPRPKKTAATKRSSSNNTAANIGFLLNTPRCAVQVRVERLARFPLQGEGRVYDPCCGSGGMLVQSEKNALANPRFNMSDWSRDRLRDHARGKHGAPPVGNTNFAIDGI